MNSLDDFGLRVSNLGRITGVSIAIHAVPDAFLLMHTGVGCKYKAAAQIAQHDWQVHPNRREAWTEVGDRALIQGSAERIGPYARSWYERRRPAFMAVVVAGFLDMTGEDFAAEVRRLDAELPCRVALIPGGGFDGDMYEGYGRTLRELAAGVDWSRRPVRDDEVAVLGYWFDRYEPDHLGNLQQLRVLLDGLGLRLGPVLLSGRPWDELMRAHRAATVVQLPYARPVAGDLDATIPRRHVRTGLPLGLRATGRWLREVAAAAGVAEERAASFAASREAYAREQLAKLTDRWRGVGAAVMADGPLAAGLCSLLDELGLRVRLVALRDTSLGGREAFDGGLDADAEILERPSMARLRERLSSAVLEQRVHVVLGSAIELGLLESAAREELAPVYGLADSHLLPPACIEIGFPSSGYHLTHAAPFLGYGGAVALAQRILNASPRLTRLIS